MKQIKKIGFWFLVLFLLLLICLPGIWIFVSAFRPNPEILSKPANWIPDRWTIFEFTQMFSIKGYVSVPAFKYLMNSIIISLFSTIIAITIGMMGGYAFARFNFKGKNKIFLGLMLARAVPGISLSLPLFILFAKLGIINTSFGVIIVYVAMNVPFTIWLTDGFFRQIPKEMSEWPPKSYVKRIFNLKRWTKMKRGGHFAALEQPDLLVNDIRTFARSLR